jgi:hypothetical protein
VIVGAGTTSQVKSSTSQSAIFLNSVGFLGSSPCLTTTR